MLFTTQKAALMKITIILRLPFNRVIRDTFQFLTLNSAKSDY
jgi:hypothetical protein